MEPNDGQFDRLAAAREKYGKAFVARIENYHPDEEDEDKSDDDRDPKHDHWDA